MPNWTLEKMSVHVSYSVDCNVQRFQERRQHDRPGVRHRGMASAAGPSGNGAGLLVPQACADQEKDSRGNRQTDRLSGHGGRSAPGAFPVLLIQVIISTTLHVLVPSLA